ncbi:hypothetical protein NU195Hw_g6414t1 [Hortaea werneckii]
MNEGPHPDHGGVEDRAAAPNMQPSPEAEKVEQHELAVEEREAFEYWDYLFKPDKTGTDRLKSLLRGLKDVINEHYEPSDNPDLTPTQLAQFYRDLHGNYDQLFLATPSESIAFIYKSLGCLHSLQPQSFAHSTAFADPTVPALKTEGWIMWQTIQLLLGPAEHSEFLREAVRRWDVKDPTTGNVFPKILPRQCFPPEPDRHMVAWYEGVSERLRREAEEEERVRELEAEQAETRRIRDKHAKEDAEDAESVGSKGPALAYFRNPLYRHVDGRPSIVRSSSKRPGMSPRPTMRDKAKDGASTMGHVIRNIGSPHLWDGRGGSRSRSRDKVALERDRRRRSLPDNKHPHHGAHLSEDQATSGSPAPGEHRGHRHRRHASGSHHSHSRPGTSGSADDEWTGPSDDPEAFRHSRPSSSHDPGAHRHPHHSHRLPAEPGLRHSKSHDPTPISSQQREGSDYFGSAAGYDERRRSSAHDATSPPATAEGGPGLFRPSASPLFATHVARQPQPPPPSGLGPPPGMRPMSGAPPPPRPRSGGPPPDMESYPPRRGVSLRGPHGRPISPGPMEADRRPDPRRDPRDPRDRYDSPRRRARFDHSPPRRDYDDRDRPPPSGRPYPPHHEHGRRSRPQSMDLPPDGGMYPPPGPRGDPRRNSPPYIPPGSAPPFDPRGAPYPPADGPHRGPPFPDSHRERERERSRRRSRRREARISTSDLSPESDDPEDSERAAEQRRQDRPKQTRFEGDGKSPGGKGKGPVTGVDGRRYAPVNW